MTRYITVDQAADLLATTPVALRHRLRRAQRKDGRQIIAPLLDGYVGVKFGRSWKIRAPQAA
jgi:hypothetical protein